MSWDFTKLAQKIPLPKELQEHLFRFLPIPVNPYVPVKDGFDAQGLRDAAGLAQESDESLSTMYLRLGKGPNTVYTSTLLIKRFPQNLNFGHFRNLAFGNRDAGGVPSIHSVRYTVEIHPIVKSLASKANEHKLNRLRHDIEDATSRHQIPDSELVKAYESLKRIINEVEYTDNLPFEIWVYITAWAPTVQALRKTIKEIKDQLAEDKTKVNSLSFEQLQGFQAGLSLGLTPEELYKEYPGRFVTSDPLTCLTPFVNGSISDGTGIDFGNSTRNNSRILIDLIKGQGGKNIAILGTTGSGKSAAQKALGQSLMEHGFRVIYLDFNGEFYVWCLNNGGAYLDQRTQTGTYIEPMMIYPQVSELDSNPIDTMIARVMRTISILADTEEEYFLVPCDQAIAQVLFENNMDREKPETWFTKSLRITDWYKALCDIHTPGAQDLRIRIQRYFEGGQSHLFGKGEPLKLDSQMIVVRLSNPEEAGEDTRASLVKMTLALDTISEQIKRDKLLGERFTAVFMDELQRSINNPVIEKFLNTWATSIRHQNGMVVTGSNKVSVYLGEKAPAQSIWSNSYIKMIFWIEDNELEILKSSKAVPEPVIEAIQNSYGQHTFMLKVADRNWEQARYELSPLELELYATRGLKDKRSVV
ncbi:protein of unknown function DUF87 [Desulfosporosinus acidiphilus SJ4]|uniref:Helicase HerA central domain-containing protein n=1 Tax=Desulfosporosinus acidiphilus (strain DSM 22704 / JCM 16185 / SJ4) TaxID=646529 RepID=I4D3U2_DESAJ|nr:DUF87 domain-containing protein [Desulfosporosinus acidiphilus]AFM40466.1 protein of unknown function DUF87 [Desulfosporosinus acidiphilus SJ4]